MKDFKEWRNQKINEDTASPVQMSRNDLERRSQGYDFADKLRTGETTPYQQPPEDQTNTGEENIEPTKEDKLLYDQELSGRLGTLWRLFLGTVFQRQQIFRRPAILYMFLRNVLAMANAVSGNPGLVNRVLLKLRAELIGASPEEAPMPQEFGKAMDQFGKTYDPSKANSRIVSQQQAQAQQAQGPQ